MCGVRMGERALQVGINDPVLAGAIAAKVGLSGHAAIAVGDDRAGAVAQRAAALVGALVDIRITPRDALPFDRDAFDLIVLHAGASVPPFGGAAAMGVFRECHRVLRVGGRIVIIEGSPKTLLKGSTLGPDDKAAVAALTGAGFGVARVLAEREGFRFTEGLKSRP